MLLVHCGTSISPVPTLTAWTFGQPSSPVVELNSSGAGLSCLRPQKTARDGVLSLYIECLLCLFCAPPLGTWVVGMTGVISIAIFVIAILSMFTWASRVFYCCCSVFGGAGGRGLGERGQKPPVSFQLAAKIPGCRFPFNPLPSPP